MTAVEEQTPGTRGFRWRNRRIVAERTGWPAGALEVCERLDGACPDWYFSWSPANLNRGFEHPAGFFATRAGWHPIELLDENPLALAAAVEQAPEDHVFGMGECWCGGGPGAGAYQERFGTTRVRTCARG